MKNLLFPLLLLLGLTACQKTGAPSAATVRWPLHQTEQRQLIDSLLIRHGNFSLTATELFLRAFKHEQRLEVWLRPEGQGRFKLLKTYDFCTSSGQLGPKRREGDRQIPEGFYHIDRFNPRSRFFLSLGLNYPNEADRKLGHPQAPGSDIFIHGGCASIGCIPIRDRGIREVYLLAERARASGQTRIPVRLYPFDFDRIDREDTYEKFPEHQAFWETLRPVYQHFERHRQLGPVEVDADGRYRTTNLRTQPPPSDSSRSR